MIKDIANYLFGTKESQRYRNTVAEEREFTLNPKALENEIMEQKVNRGAYILFGKVLPNIVTGLTIGHYLATGNFVWEGVFLSEVAIRPLQHAHHSAWHFGSQEGANLYRESIYESGSENPNWSGLDNSLN